MWKKKNLTKTKHKTQARMEKVSHLYLHTWLKKKKPTTKFLPKFIIHPLHSQKSKQLPLNTLAVLLNHTDGEWKKANSNYYSYGIDKSETGIKEAQAINCSN